MLTIYERFKATSRPIHPPISLFYQSSGFSVGDLRVDLILDEDHAMVAEVTSHPVEDGSVITDHIRNRLRTGSLRALVSSYSINPETGNTSGNTATTTAEEATERGQFYKAPNRALDAWKTLKSIYDKRELVTIVTSLETYRNVAITSIQTRRDSRTGDALEVDIEFQQIEQVKLKELQIAAAIQPDSMDADIDKKSAVNVNTGQKVANSNNMTLTSVEVK